MVTQLEVGAASGGFAWTASLVAIIEEGKLNMIIYILLALVIIALFTILSYRELKTANHLAQQAITQRLAIAEKLGKVTDRSA